MATTGQATTWWGKRWTVAIEALGHAWRNRLPRGRTYAREGRVVGLTVEPGCVGAYVVGSQPSPYRVEIKLRPLTDEEWARVVEPLIARASYAAGLLAGEMPGDIEDAFADAHVSLFPTDPRELELTCTCPDRALPCKHAAATHYMLGEAFDHDPFLLFALRGRDRDALLTELRQARVRAVAKRVGAESGPPARSRRTPDEERREVTGAAATGADRVPADERPAPDAPITLESFARARGDLGRLSFHIQPPAARMAVLQSLGKPPGWRQRESLADRLASTYEAVSRLAQAIAVGDTGGSTSAEE
jgi:uncharacterized Zn finger protein